MLDYLTLLCRRDVATASLDPARRCGGGKTDPPMLSVCAACAVATGEGCWSIGSGSVSRSSRVVVSCVRYVAPLLKRLRNGFTDGAANVVLGTIMAQRLRDEGVQSDRITVIENWADGDVIQPVPKETIRLCASGSWTASSSWAIPATWAWSMSSRQSSMPLSF
jgi:hypothetical protein